MSTLQRGVYNKMRTIKFRAWEKYSKEMIEDVTFIKDYQEDSNPWIFMQFTGLLDKHGVEIYEGDIVRAWEDDGNLIEYEVNGKLKDCFDVFWNEYYGMWNIFGKAKISLVEFEIEIIGNIYERELNPTKSDK